MIRKESGIPRSRPASPRPKTPIEGGMPFRERAAMGVMAAIGPDHGGEQQHDQEGKRDSEESAGLAAAEDTDRGRNAVHSLGVEDPQAEEEEDVGGAECDDDRMHPAEGDQD